jgi:hypothetical protein
MVVFGDSFAFGYGIDNADCFAEISPQLRIKAIGAPAYNMVQELLLMRQFALQLRGKLVVWFICIENDLIDNLSPHSFGYRSPFIRQSNKSSGWEIVTSHLDRAKWYHTSKDRPYQGSYIEVLAKLCSSNPLSERAYSACEFLIREGKQLCDEAGADFLVMTIPNVNQLTARGKGVLVARGGDPKTLDPEYPDNRISGICRALKIPFLAAGTFLDAGHYKLLDPHWNRRGHWRVAKALRDAYQGRLTKHRATGGEVSLTVAKKVSIS